MKPILSLVLLLFSLFPKARASEPAKQKDAPLEVAVSIHLNKIYDINSVNQTYMIDGYLVLSWHDSKLEKKLPEVWRQTGI